MIFIALGSSVGEAGKIFRDTEVWLELNRIEVLKKSEILKNPAMGGVAQSEFSNAVWEISFPETRWEKINWVLLPKSRKLRLKAFKLLKLLQRCERDHGRVRTKRWADRTLDLDILMFHDLILKCQKLAIPHSEISSRNFVITPWRTLVDDGFEIPTLGKLSELSSKL